MVLRVRRLEVDKKTDRYILADITVRRLELAALGLVS